MPPPVTPFPAGTIFESGYELRGTLGGGAFADVYEARRLSTGQPVAVKILHPFDRDTEQRIRERFRREMHVCAVLSHPNIVPLLDAGESSEGQLYAVFQFVPGTTLKQLIAQEGRLSVAETAHVMGQVLDALACAHAQGIVHRDLKPENIMITCTGVRRNAMVVDFGLGGLFQELTQRALPRLTASRDVMGTPCYAAPEQLRGEPPSPLSDLYSWGLIVLECLTGELVVDGASVQEVIHKQLGPEPIPVPTWLRAHPLGPLLEVVTAKSLAQRQVTIEGLLEALDPVGAGPVPRRRESAESAAERRLLTLVCCRIAVTALAGAADVEDVDEVMLTQLDAHAQIADRSGGQSAGRMGDRALFAFGYPQAHEDDPRRAARAALGMVADAARASARLGADRGLGLSVRVGLHTGVVSVKPGSGRLRGLDHLVGPAAQVALALADGAAPGEVLASGETLRLLHDEFEASPAAEVDFAGTVVPAARLAERFGVAGGRETVSARQETPLVGRERPLAELRALWERTGAGRPGAVLVRGEAGIGKSRLVRELRRQVPADAWLQARCLPEGQGSPLHPLIDLLGALDEPLEALLLRYGLDREETLPLFAALLGWPAERYVPLPLSAERQKELTLNALVTLLLRMGETRPLVFALEDLHWADPTTLEFVTLLAHELRTATLTEARGPRLGAVLTARPEFSPSWSFDDVPLVSLARLEPEEVGAMIAAGLVPGAAVDPAVVAEVVRHADGIPLFVEEVTRALVEAERVPRPPGAPTGRPFQVPDTLRNLLTARLDALPEPARETAQLGAVLGREFRYELLQAVSTKEAQALRDDLAALQAAGLLFHRRSVRSASYVFKHALVRDAAYQSLTKATRQRLHQRVANTMRHRFADLAAQRPEMLAHHFEQAGQLDTAVEYYHRAGSQALLRAAYPEAYASLDRGLSLQQALQPSAARRRQEAEILATLGNVQISTFGYAAPQVEETFRRAWELCADESDVPPTHIMYGHWAVSVTRSDRAGVERMLPIFQRIVANPTDRVAVLAARGGLGAAAYWAGDFPTSEENFARGRTLFESAEFRDFSRTFGYGVGLYPYAFGFLTLWYLGRPDQADAVRTELYRIAELARDPYATCVAIGFGMTLAHERDEPEVELALADRLMALAIEQRLPVWQAAASLGRGGALLRRGHAPEALPLIQAGVEGFRLIGVMCSYAYYLPHLAEAHWRSGDGEAALAVIAEGLGLCRTLYARLTEPELLRLQGEIGLERGDVAGAEERFRRAMQLARSGSNRAWELRAATSLARLLRQRGAAAAAHAVLAPLHAAFPDGVDTPDLRAARALLA